MSNILRMENVTFGYRNERNILDDFSYDFQLGKVYVLTGQSGSGKTTLISLLSGLLSPQRGKILFHGTDIAGMDKYNYRSHNVSLVFQNYNLLPKLTAVENVELSLHLAGDKTKNKKEKCIELLKSIGISEEESGRKILNLSGGQQQRVAIARAISHDSQVILADEPTGNLDEKNSMEIMNLFIDLAKKENKCVIIVSHSSTIASMADEVIVINERRG